MEPLVGVMRRYVVDYLNRHDTGVCSEIMVPEYSLHIGGNLLSGRDDAYVPAVAGQLRQFPGMGLTVHELVVSGDRIALRFSEHGASVRHEGAVAAWGGVGLYHWDGARLTTTFAEEDYATRAGQLAHGGPVTVERPCPAPWDEQSVAPEPDAEAFLRSWVATGDTSAPEVVTNVVPAAGEAADQPLHVDTVEIDDLFCAGRRVAFHAVFHGTYAGGLDVPPEWIGAPGSIHAAGIVELVGAGGTRTVRGHIITDRAGLQRRLRASIN
ncbi:MAG: hypothetical protein NVS3B12_29810 [Acidimicrobiales bacterium]